MIPAFEAAAAHEPASVAEAARVMEQLAREGRRVGFVGGGTELELGAPPERIFSTAPAIPSEAIHCPFFTFTARPARPAATSRSVWRQRNAGIWSTSATCAAVET